MKTNQIVVRKIGDFEAPQRTSDGYFNATALLKSWNDAARKSGDPKIKVRELDNFWKQEGIIDLMSEIAENELDFKSLDFTDLKCALSKTSRGKHNGGTWMHPVLFTKFAMYLNPRFEYHVLRFVSDQMLEFRDRAGEAYKTLASAIARIVRPNEMRESMQKVAKALNWIVFNNHETMIRNEFGDEKKMQELFQLEEKIADLINDGFITAFPSLVDYLRKLWRKKYEPADLRLKNLLIAKY